MRAAVVVRVGRAIRHYQERHGVSPGLVVIAPNLRQAFWRSLDLHPDTIAPKFGGVVIHVDDNLPPDTIRAKSAAASTGEGG